jgi:5'(3')-deoxyribonucleotidase
LSKTIIGIDIDGVLAKFTPVFIDSVNAVFPNKKISRSFEPNDWEFSEILTTDEFRPVWQDLLNKKDVWNTLDVYRDNFKSLEKFVHSQHNDFDIYYLTARCDTGGGSAFSQTSSWLLDKELLMYNSSLVVVRSPGDKPAVAKALGITAMIDDHLPTSIALSKVLGQGSCLHNRSWNANNRPSDLMVVENLEQFLNLVIENRR